MSGTDLGEVLAGAGRRITEQPAAAPGWAARFDIPDEFLLTLAKHGRWRTVGIRADVPQLPRPGTRELGAAYHGADYEQLRRGKRKYKPANFLRFPRQCHLSSAPVNPCRTAPPW